ncbi:MAG TPA: HAD family hydrolase [Stellaceae bacterium]|nr:HAD family hydrolase [Stellaceae bacterium]
MSRVIEIGGGVAPAGVGSGIAPQTIARPRAILFDWDNTLVDSWATIHDALNIVMAAMDLPSWSLAETRSRVRLSLRESFPRHFGARWEEARQIYLDAFAAIHLDRLAPLPGSAALLEGLRGLGVFLGVVSNKTGALLRREAERLGWAPYFGSIVGAGDATADKPAAAPALFALAASGIAAGDAVWLVGDTAVDMQCAINAGCRPVLLGRALPDEEFAAAPPGLAFSDGAALFRFIQDL